MIRVRIQIGDGEIHDTLDYGLIYKSSDSICEAPIKSRHTTTYAEEAGEHIDPRTLQDAFDYKVEFAVLADNKNLDNANALISSFNKLLYSNEEGSDVRTYKEVTFYNDYKRVKIVGYPEPLREVSELYRRQNGDTIECAIVSLSIRVSDPTKCDFSI